METDHSSRERARDCHDLALQSSTMAPESLLSASDDLGRGLGGGLSRPPDGFRHPTFVAGKMPQDLHSAGLLVGPYQSHILLFAKTGWGQPWAPPTGVRLLGRFAPLETLREVCPMYLGLTGGTLAPYHYQQKGFRYLIDEHDLRPGRHDQTGVDVSPDVSGTM